MHYISINFAVPQDWHELSDKQLRYAYQLIASDYSDDKLKTLCLLRWSNTKVVGRQNSGSYLLEHGKTLFEITPLMLAELLPHLDWLTSIPTSPVRISKMHRLTALPADFQGVPFETYIIVENLYQGYLATQSDDLLDELANVLYGKAIKLRPEERISVFYWIASLKDYLAKRFPDFFQPIADSTMLGTSSTSVEDAMNAQIRALTKGDVTKEQEILALDTWRALTELNAQAKEYNELNSKLNETS